MRDLCIVCIVPCASSVGAGCRVGAGCAQQALHCSRNAGVVHEGVRARRCGCAARLLCALPPKHTSQSRFSVATSLAESLLPARLWTRMLPAIGRRGASTEAEPWAADFTALQPATPHDEGPSSESLLDGLLAAQQLPVPVLRSVPKQQPQQQQPQQQPSPPPQQHGDAALAGPSASSGADASKMSPPRQRWSAAPQRAAMEIQPAPNLKLQGREAPKYREAADGKGRRVRLGALDDGLAPSPVRKRTSVRAEGGEGGASADSSGGAPPTTPAPGQSTPRIAPARRAMFAPQLVTSSLAPAPTEASSPAPSHTLASNARAAIAARAEARAGALAATSHLRGADRAAARAKIDALIRAAGRGPLGLLRQGRPPQWVRRQGASRPPSSRQARRLATQRCPAARALMVMMM